MLNINFRDVKLQEIIELMSGDYLDVAKELAFTVQHDLFKYIGCSEGKARYLVGYKLDERYDATIIFVGISSSGRLFCDYAGCPCFSGSNEDELFEYIEKRCN
jgi:hypothetical protein